MDSVYKQNPVPETIWYRPAATRSGPQFSWDYIDGDVGTRGPEHLARSAGTFLVGEYKLVRVKEVSMIPARPEVRDA